MSGKSVSIWWFMLRRLILIIPTILIVVTLVFTLIHLAPGDPALALAGDVGASPEYIEALREKYGLNEPIHVQYFTYVSLLLKGDMGFSIYFNKPVGILIAETAGPTIILIIGSTLVSVVVGILLGLLAARKPYSKMDSAISILTLGGYAMPIFWLGQLLLIALSLNLQWLPLGGMIDARRELVGIEYIADVLYHLILPACTLGLIQAAIVAQMTRTGVLEALSKNFVTAARAKGLAERAVLYRHALRDAMVTVVTIVGLNIGRVVAGAILTETTFSWPGLGRLLWQAMAVRDFPLVLGLFIVIAASVIAVNFVADIAYAFLDPRIRYR